MTDDTDADGDDRKIVGGTTGEDAAESAPDVDVGATRGETTVEMSGDDATQSATPGDAHGAETVETGVDVGDDETGKTVRSADGEELGLVTDVDASADALFVDPHPRVAEHVAADHGWTERESGDFRVDAADVKAIDGDAVWMRDDTE